jgi:methyl-accepting chemotaxis protein
MLRLRPGQGGEAGKGFAVVANEVKELAKNTAKATEDISRRIEAIQTDTQAAVEAIATILAVINQINGIAGITATAVEEQNATTNGMSRNVSDAARSSSEITSNLSGLAEAAESTSRDADGHAKGSAGVGRSCRCNCTVWSSDSRVTPTKIGGTRTAPKNSQAVSVGAGS